MYFLFLIVPILQMWWTARQGICPLQRIAGDAGAESTPIFGSLRNRPTHWLTRKLDADRYRNLPLDGPSKAAATGRAPTEGGGKDIRNLFAQAGHQGEDQTGQESYSQHFYHSIPCSNCRHRHGILLEGLRWWSGHGDDCLYLHEDCCSTWS